MKEQRCKIYFFYTSRYKKSMKDTKQPKDKIIQFNHISKNLTDEKVEELKNLYRNYHKLTKCYKWQYKKLRKRKVMLQVLRVTLVTVGGGLSAVIPLNAIIVIGGAAIYAWMEKSNLPKMVENCRLAYTTYEKILHQIKGILRNGEFNKTVEVKLLSDLLVIDGIITDVAMPIDNLFKKYYKIYQ